MAELDNEDDALSMHISTLDDMLIEGLMLANFTEKQIERCCKKTNLSRFNSKFGTSPAVVCAMYEDLQKTALQSMRLDGSQENLRWLLRSMMYLRKYILEDDFEAIFKMSARYGRQKIWDTIEKIQYLKWKKITWQDDCALEDIWVMTVDGTHMWIQEPKHETYSKDPEYFSHKFNKSGINYELGIAIASQKLIWMNGPFKAGRNDLNIFIEEGLEQRLLLLGKKAIGDGIYQGHNKAVSFPNRCDSYGVAKFKSRALKRHESFNGMIKNFRILSDCFRHRVDKIALAFESVAVICQYKIEREEPLYDVLIEDVVFGDYKADDV